VATNWSPGSGAASWSESSDTGTGQQTQYQVGVPNPQTNTTYLLTWYEVTMDPTSLVYTVTPRQETLRQQNLWVGFGSGRRPNV